MKKTMLKSVFMLSLLVPCLILFSACAVKLNQFHFRVNLNHPDANYTQAYLDAHDFSSKNIVYILNPDRYDKVAEKLPSKGDLIMPEGKTLGGWYLDENCSADKYFNETNWKALVAEKKAQGSKNGSAYAYWIDETDVSLSFDLNNQDATFKDEYKTELSINHNSPRFVGTAEEVAEANLPELADINVPEGKEFGGWYLNKELTIMLNPTTIANMATLSANLRVYAKWVNRLEVSAIIFTATDDSESPLTEFTFSNEIRVEYDNDMSADSISYTVYRDEFAKIASFLATLPTEIQTAGAAYTFDAWKIITWREGGSVLLDFNETNWLEETDVSASQSFTSIWIYATWTPLGA